MAISSPPQFECEVRPDRDRVVVALTGELDVATAPEVRSTIDDLVLAGFLRMTIDLSGLTFICSTGLHVLMHASQIAADHRCALSFVRGSDPVHRPFLLTGLDNTLVFEPVPKRRRFTRSAHGPAPAPVQPDRAGGAVSCHHGWLIRDEVCPDCKRAAAFV